MRKIEKFQLIVVESKIVTIPNPDTRIRHAKVIFWRKTQNVRLKLDFPIVKMGRSCPTLHLMKTPLDLGNIETNAHKRKYSPIFYSTTNLSSFIFPCHKFGWWRKNIPTLILRLFLSADLDGFITLLREPKHLHFWISSLGQHYFTCSKIFTIISSPGPEVLSEELVLLFQVVLFVSVSHNWIPLTPLTINRKKYI